MAPRKKDTALQLATEVAAQDVRAATPAFPPPALTQPAPEICDAPPVPPDRATIAARIQFVVEREMDAVERVLDVIGPADGIEAERTARTLATVAHTLREIAAFNQMDEGAAPNETDDDPVPLDIDEFRYELARRIRGFIEARRVGAGRLPDESESALE